MRDHLDTRPVFRLRLSGEGMTILPRPSPTDPFPGAPWTEESWLSHREERRWHSPYCSAGGLPCPIHCEDWPDDPAEMFPNLNPPLPWPDR